MLAVLLLAAILDIFPNEARIVYDRWPNHKERTVFEVVNGELVAAHIARDGKQRELARYNAPDVHAIKLFDVTGNGEPELLVRLSPGNRSTPIEILRWNGTRFRLIGETNEYSTFIDLDHDGVNEMVENGTGEENECGGRTGVSYVTRFRNGRFEKDAEEHADVFTQTKDDAEPLALQYPFFLPDDASTKCRLHFVNGTRGGKHRVSRIEVKVRQFTEKAPKPGQGKRVAVALSRDNEYADAVVRLPSRCAFLDVTTFGPAAATVAVVVDSVK
jgi:hypothetical protein